MENLPYYLICSCSHGFCVNSGLGEARFRFSSLPEFTQALTLLNDGVGLQPSEIAMGLSSLGLEYLHHGIEDCPLDEAGCQGTAVRAESGIKPVFNPTALT